MSTPFRSEPLYFGKKKIAYFRLHGFGSTSMYNYSFSLNELKSLKKKIEKLDDVERVYVMFNNSDSFENATQFINDVM